MPTCGHCNKSVAASDITCPHCGVLLAAYASPTGSGAAGTYEAPPAPPSAEIPDVDMDVKPPSEADIITDPTKVTEEQVSTAPRPLFDTFLTVEEIARAAEGNHDTDVVTVTDGKIATKKVEFDVPDYARPPTNAAPIPTIDEDDDSIPLITRDNPVERTVPTERRHEDEESEPEPEPDRTGESWLQAPPPTPRARTRRKPAPTRTTTPDPDRGPVGQTDSYLRQLHQEAGYQPTGATISQPVEERRVSPIERARHRRAASNMDPDQGTAAAEHSTKLGCSLLYVMMLGVLWLSLVISVAGGSISPLLIFVTVALTWGFRPITKLIREMQSA